jgi:UDP-N-acetylmuramoylalanine--D-glutamate ligase
VRLLRSEHTPVVVVDDSLADLGRVGDPDLLARVDAVRAIGGVVSEPPADWSAFLRDRSVALVVPSPGVRPDHPLIRVAVAASVPVRSEIDLAAERISAPIVAVTGTNGKTTVTELIVEMLRASGLATEFGGNIGDPLVNRAGSTAEVVVAEVSSFQLEFTTTVWRPRVAVLVNVADDHLDWHGSRARYEAAKAKVFANQRTSDTLVANVDDPCVAALIGSAAARIVGVHASNDQHLTLTDGRHLLDVRELPRGLPHDRLNSVVAAEAALALGADLDAVRSVLRRYVTRPHRVQYIATVDGVDYYDDSKATNPHATIRAVAAFPSVVLCAGGLNKSLDLGVLAADVSHIRAVVAFGDASDEIVAAFSGRRPVVVAATMDEVVSTAATHAVAGDVVLLSPGCASFDAYANYGERGDDFARSVRARLATVEANP